MRLKWNIFKRPKKWQFEGKIYEASTIPLAKPFKKVAEVEAYNRSDALLRFRDMHPNLDVRIRAFKGREKRRNPFRGL